MVRISSTCRSATQPSTKNVARASCRASSSSKRATSPTTRDSRRSHADRATRDSNAETWKYSSTSMVKWWAIMRSEEHTSELQSRLHLVCRLLLEKKKKYRETN